MSKINLYYAELSNVLDIPKKEFNRIEHLFNYLLKELNEEKKCVYLLSFFDTDQKKDLVFVSEYYDFILDILQNTHFSFDVTMAKDIHLQEYPTFEEAYAVALSMKEESPLCYNEGRINTNLS